MKWYVTPPPTLTGNDKKDIENMHNYLVELHNGVSMLANNNIDADNMTDDLKQKLKQIDNNTNQLNKIIYK